MASIYCGGTADDVPLFCVDVARKKSCSRRNTSHHRHMHFSFMEVGNDRRN